VTTGVRGLRDERQYDIDVGGVLPDIAVVVADATEN
jgi:hypothetical protein